MLQWQEGNSMRSSINKRRKRDDVGREHGNRNGLGCPCDFCTVDNSFMAHN